LYYALAKSKILCHFRENIEKLAFVMSLDMAIDQMLCKDFIELLIQVFALWIFMSDTKVKAC